MNIDTLIKLEQSDNERLRGIAKLAIILDMKYKDTEKLVDKMKKQLEARKKTLELFQIKGTLNVNDNLKLKVKNDSKKTPIKILDGTIAQKNDYFIAVKLKNYIECFGYADFLTGKAVII